MTSEQHLDSSMAEQAAYWYLLMHGDELPSEEQLQGFLQWLQDPVAEQAYAHCETLWELSAALQEDTDILSSRDKSQWSYRYRVLAWWRSIPQMARHSMAAACVAAIAVVVVWTNQQHSVQAHYDVFQTATGQQKTVTLADGSQLTLNTSSEVHVSYRDDIRKVMLESGEVLFDVAKDRYRPFTVIAGNGQIKALGTIFNVKKLSNRSMVEVALLEGSVEVNAHIETPDSNSHRQKQLLSANQSIAYNSETVTAVLPIEDVEKITQWKEGRLSFSNATLAEVVEQVNRYTINKLLVEDRLLQSEKIEAYFVIGDTENLLLALKETLGISWSYRNDGILLYREAPSG